ncbi:hypothetical protein LTR62_002758 [Meristemomyces frigidus]|uniref:Uncharacterized protein n=1 Tax=Meristemomyces frigidus TaxID=1508187 RepID=A0AAN7YHH4_9PEZI|nr:hypothetical protein LTR62_002758 [Meristemomyces frigidus]
MAPLKFDDLPEDVKAHIVDRVSPLTHASDPQHGFEADKSPEVLRPTDLRSLCLTSKLLHTLAVKPLYRTVSLDLGSEADTRLSAFLSPANIGLKHVRRVRVYLAAVRDVGRERGNHQRQSLNFATRMLLEFLPGDRLDGFSVLIAVIHAGFPVVVGTNMTSSWYPCESFSADNLLLLYRKQKKMKWLQVMSMDRDVLPELKHLGSRLDGLFAGVRKLVLYPENRPTLELCQFFVEKTKETLEELVVHANFDLHDRFHDRDHSPPPPVVGAIDAREVDDSATGPGILSRTIFANLLPFESCTPLQCLTSLRLRRVNLRHCADTWCKFVDFTRLQNLKLYHCAGVDSLFGQMSKAAHLPRQLKVLEVSHKDNAENEALVALDGFLCLVSGIQDLVVDLENVTCLPAAAGVARHSKTLELLSVHASEDETVSGTVSGTGTTADEHVWSLENLINICKACTKIEQLSCAWPQTSILRAPGPAWKGYEIAVLSHLRDLVTLQISTFPTNNKPSGQLLPRVIYEQLLQGLATSMFDCAVNIVRANKMPSSTITDVDGIPIPAFPPNTEIWFKPSSQPSKFRLLAFGISDTVSERKDSKNQIIFLKSCCKNAMGEEKPYAAPIGWCARQFVEPRSRVLEVPVQRESKVPAKDGPVARGNGFGIGGHAGWDEDE